MSDASEHAAVRGVTPQDQYRVYYDVHLQGAVEPLTFRPGRTSCGDIEDGVAFEFAERGSWIMAYETLMELARLATERRTEGTRQRVGNQQDASTDAGNAGALEPRP